MTINQRSKLVFRISCLNIPTGLTKDRLTVENFEIIERVIKSYSSPIFGNHFTTGPYTFKTQYSISDSLAQFAATFIGLTIKERSIAHIAGDGQRETDLKSVTGRVLKQEL